MAYAVCMRHRQAAYRWMRGVIQYRCDSSRNSRAGHPAPGNCETFYRPALQWRQVVRTTDVDSTVRWHGCHHQTSHCSALGESHCVGHQEPTTAYPQRSTASDGTALHGSGNPRHCCLHAAWVPAASPHARHRCLSSRQSSTSNDFAPALRPAQLPRIATLCRSSLSCRLPHERCAMSAACLDRS